jgi:hypothetical protein
MNPVGEKNRAVRSEGRDLKADRNWKVLLIGDHGRVIPFKRIKTLIWLTIGVITSALAAVVVLLVVNAGLHGRTRELQKQLEASGVQVQALRQERDMLTAQVMLVETKMKETLAGVNRPPPPGAKASPAPGAGKPIEPSISPAPAAAAAAPEPAAPVGPFVGIGDGLAVEGFHARFDAVRRTLELNYELIATASGRKPLRGHVIVVFKGDGIEPEHWLAMPQVDLPKGRPSGRQKGYSFSISGKHSKVYSHSMPAPAVLSAYTQAVMYVFSNEGQLMMARDYAVEVKPADG